MTLISLTKTNLFSLWIFHLFIVIPNNGGLGALKYFFDQRIVKEPSSETLLRLAEVVLILNYFSLGGNKLNYKQTNGVAGMDTTNTNFLVNTTAPLNLNFTTATLITISALPHLPERSSLNS